MEMMTICISLAQLNLLAIFLWQHYKPSVERSTSKVKQHGPTNGLLPQQNMTAEKASHSKGSFNSPKKGG
jgi:hypothetical protein